MIILAYVPVLHEGYRRFFEKYKGAKLMLLGDKVKEKFVPLVKDLRALPVELIKKSIESWNLFSEVEIVDIEFLKNLPKEEIIMPNEDIMRELEKEYFSDNKNIKFESIFLRWDKHKSMEKKPMEIDQVISRKNFDKKMMKAARNEAEKSADFWRNVGAVVVKNDKIILSNHNHHVPQEQQPYVDGDPRGDFHKGINLEISTAIHSEAHLVAEAAQKGISLEGSSIYVTAFPCPPCAKMIAYSGIKKIYYADGYAVFDGERVLKSKGVEIIFVEEEAKEKDAQRTPNVVEYKSKKTD
jgi:dCMP deaminase